jgi:hypothetical protein
MFITVPTGRSAVSERFDKRGLAQVVSNAYVNEPSGIDVRRTDPVKSEYEYERLTPACVVVTGMGIAVGS